MKIYLLLAIILILSLMIFNDWGGSQCNGFMIGGQPNSLNIPIGSGGQLPIRECNPSHCCIKGSNLKNSSCIPGTDGVSCSYVCPKPEIRNNVSATHFNASCNCSGDYTEVPPIGSIAYNSSNVYPCYCPISNRLPPSANPGDVDNYCKQFNDNKKCCPTNHTKNTSNIKFNSGSIPPEAQICKFDSTSKQCTGNLTCGEFSGSATECINKKCCYSGSFSYEYPEFPSGLCGNSTGYNKSTGKARDTITCDHQTSKCIDKKGDICDKKENICDKFVDSSDNSLLCGDGNQCDDSKRDGSFTCKCTDGMTGPYCNEYPIGTAFNLNSDNTIELPTSVVKDKNKIPMPVTPSKCIYLNKLWGPTNSTDLNYSDASGNFSEPKPPIFNACSTKSFCPFGPYTCSNDPECSYNLCGYDSNKVNSGETCIQINGENASNISKCNEDKTCSSFSYASDSQLKNMQLSNNSTSNTSQYCDADSPPAPPPAKPIKKVCSNRVPQWCEQMNGESGCNSTASSKANSTCKYYPDLGCAVSGTCTPEIPLPPCNTPAAKGLSPRSGTITYCKNLKSEPECNGSYDSNYDTLCNWDGQTIGKDGNPIGCVTSGKCNPN